ncbi:MAG: aminotransferase [Sulfurimonas sp. RIFOXYD12_FULL_33_39]|uniref:aminotransferase class V-fold PLP-dependent enzyme n=1 Tax=unclassified Sulfurimonas TaxID=2623549 RepID=UPI0008D01CB7|nr:MULTISPECIES: aminotransferase class V-fold PLP-dependent enzyme [unclassified Sulfurimonas]OHE07710.1 MAG: aminotransferase [Sulfurimonas sp. RIFCSPLOWO2_12_FULL_34_6]OHE10990.1 MAG: aminotransferase [Sulfurimonas sp. RIFOXYD12_FULL_33_39]OHE13534.1 MAG: aminotransferase [Sulfurimonas sp. RIFOXYD2_FULL_34_21]
MAKNIFRPILLCRGDVKEELGIYTIGLHKKNYFDYTASGLAYEIIEDRILEVLQTYANTHSKEAGMAATTGKYYEKAREKLYENLEIDDNFVIIPNGCGATAAIKRFQELVGIYIPPATAKRYKIDVKKDDMPLVIVGPYEHHSNEISYREAFCDVVRIGLDKDGLIDFAEFEELLRENSHRELIGSFCIASNVTGIITPYKKISKLLRKYGAIVCFDAAASSAYMNVDCTLYDAMFLSAHKLLGGPGSCGLLIVRKNIIDDTLPPTFAGGGTFSYVSKTTHTYDTDLHVREEAGTPGILQFIRASLAYQLRNEIGFDFIKKEKDKLLKFFLDELQKIPNCEIYGNKREKNIGIVSFNIGNLDPYDLCKALSSRYGIETRAGCSCAGPYGHDLLGLKDQLVLGEKPGWIRIGMHFTQKKSDIQNLLEAIKKGVKTLEN